MFGSDFVNQYCYVHGTYFVPLNESLPLNEDERRQKPINYYQWVPYILALQAFLFYLPRFIWTTLISICGYDLAGAIQYVDSFWTSIKSNEATFKSRIAAFEGRPSVYIWDGLRLARKKGSKNMAIYYTISSLIQTVNSWCQWYWLAKVLQSPLHHAFWGPPLVVDLLNGIDWQITGHFPRITHCDFNRRRPASVQIDTVLCVLSLNLYYEKLFIFLWFWLLFVAIMSTSNSIQSAINLCIGKKARRIVTDYLSTSPETPAVSKDNFFKILGMDGLFVLQQMTLNLGDIPTSYLTIAMRNISQQWEEDDTDDEERPLKSFKGI